MSTDFQKGQQVQVKLEGVWLTAVYDRKVDLPDGWHQVLVAGYRQEVPRRRLRLGHV